MRTLELDNEEAERDVSIKLQDSPSTRSTKLERRRRIEDINEERRLLDELEMY